MAHSYGEPLKTVDDAVRLIHNYAMNLFYYPEVSKELAELEAEAHGRETERIEDAPAGLTPGK